MTEERKADEQLVTMTLAQATALMQAQGGTLTAVVDVTRKDTGQVERHTLVMTPIKEPTT